MAAKITGMQFLDLFLVVRLTGIVFSFPVQSLFHLTARFERPMEHVGPDTLEGCEHPERIL